MAPFSRISSDDRFQEVINLANIPPSKPSLLQLIRLSRAKLGFVADRLEDSEFDATTLQQLDDQAQAIAYELDTLVRAVQRLTDE